MLFLWTILIAVLTGVGGYYIGATGALRHHTPRMERMVAILRDQMVFSNTPRDTAVNNLPV